MSDYRRLRYRSGGLIGSPLIEVWTVGEYSREPEVPNLPLESEPPGPSGFVSLALLGVGGIASAGGTTPNPGFYSLALLGVGGIGGAASTDTDPFEIDAPLQANLSGTLTAAGDIGLGIGLSGNAALSGALTPAGDLALVLGLSGTAALSGALTPAGDIGLALGLAGSVSLSGTLAIAGDFEITNPGGSPFDLEPTAAVGLVGTLTPAGEVGLGIGLGGSAALSGSLAVAGDLAFTIETAVEPTAAVALTGSLAITGDVQYSETPIATDVPAGHGATSRRQRTDRLELADITPTAELVLHQNRLETERRIRAIIAVLAAAEIL